MRPVPRRRSRLALTLSEREEISRGIAVHRSARSMAGLLGRSPSTVSREISRNGGYDGYRAALADDRAWTRTRRPKRCKLATNAWLRQAVASKLRLNWAPEQIAGWLKRVHPEDERYPVSHEAIYRSLFVQARGVLKKELLYHLRSKRTIRRSKQAGLISDGRAHNKDIISIAVYLFKPEGCSRKSCFTIFGRSARSVDRNRRVSSVMDGDKSRISSRSVSGRQRLKIGRCPAIGKAICCPGRTTAISPPWSSVIPVTRC